MVQFLNAFSKLELGIMATIQPVVPPVEETTTKDLTKAEDNTDIFPDLEVVFVCKHSFDKKQLIDNFKYDTIEDERVISLMKRVFQNKYPATKINGFPKVPHKKSDKEHLIKMITYYFNNLRSSVIQKKNKSGNTVSLREQIEHLQCVNMLIDHFENDKETFPYDMFQEYIDNQEYFEFSSDLVNQLAKIKTKEYQETRIKNLLRQFARLYLLNRGDDQYILKDPGITEAQLDDEISKLKGSVPSVLIQLIDLLKGKMKEEGDVDYEFINNLIGKLRNEFNVIQSGIPSSISDTTFSTEEATGEIKPTREEVTTSEPPVATTQPPVATVGGNKKQSAEETITNLVNEIFDAYKALKNKHDTLVPNHASELAVKQDIIKENENKIKEHENKIAELNKSETDKGSEIKQLQTEINNLQEEKEQCENSLQQYQDSLKQRDIIINKDREFSEQWASELARLQEILNEESDKTSQARSAYEELEQEKEFEVSKLKEILREESDKTSHARNAYEELEQEKEFEITTLKGILGEEKEKNKMIDILKEKFRKLAIKQMNKMNALNSGNLGSTFGTANNFEEEPTRERKHNIANFKPTTSETNNSKLESFLQNNNNKNNIGDFKPTTSETNKSKLESFLQNKDNNTDNALNSGNLGSTFGTANNFEEEPTRERKHNIGNFKPTTSEINNSKLESFLQNNNNKDNIGNFKPTTSETNNSKLESFLQNNNKDNIGNFKPTTSETNNSKLESFLQNNNNKDNALNSGNLGSTFGTANNFEEEPTRDRKQNNIKKISKNISEEIGDTSANFGVRKNENGNLIIDDNDIDNLSNIIFDSLQKNKNSSILTEGTIEEQNKHINNIIDEAFKNKKFKNINIEKIKNKIFELEKPSMNNALDSGNLGSTFGTANNFEEEPTRERKKNNALNSGNLGSTFGTANNFEEEPTRKAKPISEKERRNAVVEQAKQRALAKYRASQQQKGGSNTLYSYCVQVAENRLDDFLIEEPLPFFSLIKDFEKSSKMDVIRESNEFYILQKFIELQLEEHFDNNEMKNFYYEFKNIFNKSDYEELAEFSFIMYELCNRIHDEKQKKIDVVKLLDTKYASYMDELERKVNINYDFYGEAIKNLNNDKKISLKFHENHIYFYKNTNSFEKIYSINDTFELSLLTEDFNEEIYYVNDSMLYYFYILSTYFLLKKDIEPTEFLKTLDKHSRTMKRKSKSSKKLLQERLDKNNGKHE